MSMSTEEVLTQLRNKYRCKVHPTDKKSIVIYGVSLKDFGKICERFMCSGFYNEENQFGVATNFGLYK